MGSRFYIIFHYKLTLNNKLLNGEDQLDPASQEQVSDEKEDIFNCQTFFYVFSHLISHFYYIKE